MKYKFLQTILCAAILSFGKFPITAAHAGNQFLEEGIQKYNLGQYTEAVGLLGAAAGSEHNNPVLHYYMASCYAKMNLKPDAIREYNIVLALQPKGKLADYSRQALGILQPAAPAPARAPVVEAAPPQALPGSSSTSANATMSDSLWLETRLAELHAEQQEKMNQLRSLAVNQTRAAEERYQQDLARISTNSPQSIMSGRRQATNTEYAENMQRIETDHVNSINQINEDLQRKLNETQAYFYERERAFRSSAGAQELRSRQP